MTIAKITSTVARSNLKSQDFNSDSDIKTEIMQDAISDSEITLFISPMETLMVSMLNK